jgi:predicted PurR-regulated permease PerM
MAPFQGRSATAAVWILALVALVFLLRAARQLLIPIALGVLISYILEPVVAWLERRRVPRVAGATLLMLAMAGLAAWGVYSLRDDVVAATDALPKAARRAREMVFSQKTSGPGANVRKAAQELRGGVPAGTSGTETRAASAERKPSGDAVTTGADPQPTASEASSSTSGLFGLLQQGVGSLVALAGHLVTITFLVYFLLLSGGHVRQRLVEVAGPPLERRRVTARIVDDINAQIQRFLFVRAFTGVIVAAATWAVLAWMGVAQAAVWGILAGVFNSIPYFGPVIVSGGLFIVGLVQSGEVMQGVKIAAAALAITSLEGWLITPPLLGKAERMHVLVVFLGLLVWTWIWGAWGTILAVPMLVVVKAMADHVDSLKPVRRLMEP